MAIGTRVYFMKDLYGTNMGGIVKNIYQSRNVMDNGRIIVTASLDNGKSITEYIELFTIA